MPNHKIESQNILLRNREKRSRYMVSTHHLTIWETNTQLPGLGHISICNSVRRLTATTFLTLPSFYMQWSTDTPSTTNMLSAILGIQNKASIDKKKPKCDRASSAALSSDKKTQTSQAHSLPRRNLPGPPSAVTSVARKAKEKQRKEHWFCMQSLKRNLISRVDWIHDIIQALFSLNDCSIFWKEAAKQKRNRNKHSLKSRNFRHNVIKLKP